VFVCVCACPHVCVMESYPWKSLRSMHSFFTTTCTILMHGNFSAIQQHVLFTRICTHTCKSNHCNYAQHILHKPAVPVDKGSYSRHIQHASAKSAGSTLCASAPAEHTHQRYLSINKCAQRIPHTLATLMCTTHLAHARNIC
jgi:hypothetical protein